MRYLTRLSGLISSTTRKPLLKQARAGMPALLPQYQRVSGSGAASHGSFFPWAVRGQLCSIPGLKIGTRWYWPAEFMGGSNSLDVKSINRQVFGGGLTIGCGFCRVFHALTFGAYHTSAID